jgi:hypothetical protein
VKENSNIKDIFCEARAKGRQRLERRIFWIDDRPICRILTMVRYQTDNVVRISAPISAAPSSENFTLVNEGASHKSPTMGQPRTVNGR